MGERELAEFLRQAGYAGAARGQQHKGGGDSPDVICPGLGSFHIECKRVESGNLYAWLDQATRDGVGKVPVVMHRRNDRDWVAILPLTDFLNLMTFRSE